MSFNVLCNDSAKTNFFPGCPQQFLEFKYRASLVVEEVLRSGCDVVCLQDVDGFEVFKESLAGRYEGRFKQRTGSKKDGCAIFWLRDKFLLVEELGVELDTLASLKNDLSLKKHNVGLLTELQCVVGAPERLVVGCVNLFWQPDALGLKINQTQYFLEEAVRFRGDSDAPMVICGNFNSPREGIVYNLLQKCVNKHYPCPLFDAYRNFPSYWSVSDKKSRETFFNYIWLVVLKRIKNSHLFSFSFFFFFCF